MKLITQMTLMTVMKMNKKFKYHALEQHPMLHQLKQIDQLTLQQLDLNHRPTLL